MILENAIQETNERLRKNLEASPCLASAQLFGLAEPILRKDRNDEVIPAIISPKGEDTYIQLDDEYPFGLYHRLLSRTYQSARGYGDDQRYTCIDEVLTVCWGFREKVNPLALESYLFASLPPEARVMQSSFDRFSVFSGEFSGVPFFFPEDAFLFSLKYRVQYSLTAGCTNTKETICNS